MIENRLVRLLLLLVSIAVAWAGVVPNLAEDELPLPNERSQLAERSALEQKATVRSAYPTKPQLLTKAQPITALPAFPALSYIRRLQRRLAAKRRTRSAIGLGLKLLMLMPIKCNTTFLSDKLRKV